MKLFILRHGIAVDHDAPGITHDSERALTPEGGRKTRLIAQALGKLEVKPDVILTSPYLRAQQTAEIVATVLGLKDRLKPCLPLACGGDAKKLIAEINQHHANAESVMLVGHNPDLGELASLLLTGHPEGALIELKKGGLCVLETPKLRAGRCAVLQWLASPKLLLSSRG